MPETENKGKNENFNTFLIFGIMVFAFFAMRGSSRCSTEYYPYDVHGN